MILITDPTIYSWSITAFAYFYELKGPSTLATFFSHRWPPFCGRPELTRATCGGDSKVSYIPTKFPYSAKFPTLLSGCHMPHEQSLVCSLPNAATKTLCLWRGRATACRSLEPQTAVCLKIMVSTGINIPATKTRPPVAKQSGQCARTLKQNKLWHSLAQSHRSFHASICVHNWTKAARDCSVECKSFYKS